ncbi:MAG: 50S ribosomal protein L20 [Candidatus Schekmanbacteria bacterium]|nr:50S ribosomal protein L20 [Candidatus Schekmanbacteria bacterium]
MPRAKGGFKTRRRRNKLLKLAKGYWNTKSSAYAKAAEQLLKSLTYSYRDRKVRKRDFRQLWITRINAAARINGISYSKLMNGLKKTNVEIDRKMLAEIAIKDPSAFTKIVETAKTASGN